MSESGSSVAARNEPFGVDDVPPAKLYRYRPALPSDQAELSWHRDVVANSCLWLASPRALNDPFDCNPCWEGQLTEVDIALYMQVKGAKMLSGLHGRKKHEHRQRVRGRLRNDEFFNDSWNKQVDRVGICCFTPAPDNELMWAHYASSHRGYCLEFTMGIGDYRTFDVPLRVRYVSELPRLSRPEFFRATLPRQVPMKGLITRSFCTKHSKWSYEQEWRLVKTDADGQRLVSYPPPLLTAIVLGHRMPHEDRMQIKGWVQTRAAPVRLLQARPDAQNYAMHIEPAMEL